MDGGAQRFIEKEGGIGNYSGGDGALNNGIHYYDGKDLRPVAWEEIVFRPQIIY